MMVFFSSVTFDKGPFATQNLFILWELKLEMKMGAT